MQWSSNVITLAYHLLLLKVGEQDNLYRKHISTPPLYYWLRSGHIPSNKLDIEKPYWVSFIGTSSFYDFKTIFMIQTLLNRNIHRASIIVEESLQYINKIKPYSLGCHKSLTHTQDITSNILMKNNFLILLWTAAQASFKSKCCWRTDSLTYGAQTI